MSDNYWVRKQLGRRRLLLGGAQLASAGAAFTLVGCGDDSSSAPATQEGSPGATQASSPAATTPATPKKGGEVTFGVGTSNQPLDPHVGLSTFLAYWSHISNLLVWHDVRAIEPLRGELVESWEQVDDQTLILKARQGVKWHEGKSTNGRAFTVEDVKFNIERISGKYDPNRIAQFSRASLIGGVDRVDVTDSTTARVVFSRPNATFLTGLSDLRNWTVPKELVNSDPDFKDPKNFVGTGAFTIQSWDAATAVGEFAANPNYWKRGRPYLDKVKQLNLPDPAATEAAFLSGKTSFFQVQSDELRKSVRDNRKDAKIVDWEGPLWDYLRLNQTRPAFQDPRVRQAVFKALNYAEMMDAGYGKNYWNYTGALVSGFPGARTSDQLSKVSPWNPSTKTQDIADAKRLMGEAGFPDGGISFKIIPTGSTGVYFDHSLRIQDQLKRIWPNMKVEVAPPVDQAGFQRSLTTGDYDAVVYTSGAVPSLALECLLHYRTGGSRNYTKFSNPDIDRLIDSSLVTFDQQKLNQQLGELEKVLLDNIWVIPLGKGRAAAAVQKEVQGFEATGIGGFNGALDPPFFSDQLYIA